MVKERDEVARRTLTRPEMPADIRATRELAENIEAMSNEDRESEIKRYAQEISGFGILWSLPFPRCKIASWWTFLLGHSGSPPNLIPAV